MKNCWIRFPVTVLALSSIMPLVFGADDNDLVYRTLAQRVGAGDFTVDFRALRMACVKSSVCEPRGSKGDLALMNRADSEHDSQKVIELGEQLVKKCFVDIEAHATLVNAYLGIHDKVRSDFHLRVTTALLRSILESGDGKSTETAYEVISDREEYDTLTSLGLRYFGPMVSQASVHENGHAYDRFEITNSVDGRSRFVFFNIDAFSEKSHAR